MGKHAYLIMANSNLKIIELCLRMIDDTRNDIYILFDKKARITSEIKGELEACLEFSAIKFAKEKTVNWAGYSQIQAVLDLMEEADKAEVEYEYVHFFQGSDIPIKTQDAIHEYFSVNKGYQYVSVEKKRKKMAENKANFRHFLCHNRWFRTNKLIKGMNFGLVYLQRALHIKKNRDIDLYQGSALFSITGDCACYILSKKNEIRKRFRFSLAADEVFLQTILMRSEYRDKIKDITADVSFNARLIDRSRPDGKNSPHIWRSDEVDYILNQPEGVCFARKFDEKVDLKAAQMIYQAIK